METNKAVKQAFDGLDIPKEFDACLRRNLLSAFEDETWLSMVAGGVKDVGEVSTIFSERFSGEEITPKS